MSSSRSHSLKVSQAFTQILSHPRSKSAAKLSVSADGITISTDQDYHSQELLKSLKHLLVCLQESFRPADSSGSQLGSSSAARTSVLLEPCPLRQLNGLSNCGQRNATFPPDIANKIPGSAL